MNLKIIDGIEQLNMPVANHKCSKWRGCKNEGISYLHKDFIYIYHKTNTIFTTFPKLDNIIFRK